MTIPARLLPAVLLCFATAACDRPAPGPASPAGPATAGPSPVAKLLEEAGKVDEEVAAALHRTVEAELAGAEDRAATSRAALVEAQRRELDLFARAAALEPKNAAIPKARGTARWRWLVSSVDHHDHDRAAWRERAALAAEALRDADAALLLSPDDAESLLLRGRITLLHAAEKRFAGIDYGLFGDQGTWPPRSALTARGSAGEVAPDFDRAIADFTRAVAQKPGDAEGFHGRALAFWFKALSIGANSMSSKEAHPLVDEDLSHAKKNIEQALFLQPQLVRHKKLARQIAAYWDQWREAANPLPPDPDKTPQEIFRVAAGAVVAITAELDNASALGSGSILTKKGLILTNRHVVEGARRIVVELRDGRSFDAKQVALHDTQDLALIRISGSVDDLPTLSLELEAFPTAVPVVGDETVIIGHPKGLKWTLTVGKISAFRGSPCAVLQTDAAVNPGNSGGPVLNLKGRIIGVVSSKIAASEGLTLSIWMGIVAPFVRKYR